MAKGVTRVVIELVDDDGDEYELVFDHESIARRRAGAGSGLAGLGSLFFLPEDVAKTGRPANARPSLRVLDEYKKEHPRDNEPMIAAQNNGVMRRKRKRDYGKDGTGANGGVQPFTDYLEGHDGECEWF